MDINKLISDFQQLTPQLAASYCIINRTFVNLDVIERMGRNEFSSLSKTIMPTKLYKYFSNKPEEVDGKKVNYSIQALENNTVFLQSPSKFDDVYDSDIHLEPSTYEKMRLMEYCRRCKIKVDNTLSTEEIGNFLLQALWTCVEQTGKLDSVFKNPPETESIELSNQLFIYNLLEELKSNNDLSKALANVIKSDFEKYSTKLKETFRASCFATTPYSQLMWGGAYGDCHRGFCVEYTVMPHEEKYKEAYSNLFPMVYYKVRPDMTDRIASLQEKELTDQCVWDVYFHGALRKSIDWAYQNEWRFLMPLKSKNNSDFNREFFPITKVFLGNRMSQEERKKIIEICNKRNIPYIGVTRNSQVFEMQDCPIKCEECPKYINQSQS